MPAHRLARPLAELLGHPPGREARREPARLEHDHLAVAGEPAREQRGRHAGRLPGARRRLDHRRAVAPERLREGGEGVVDGQAFHACQVTRRRRFTPAK
ncbi:MAG: hypothetical protein QM704_27145 [Anaeromyxobacteraceae bacterium]